MTALLKRKVDINKLSREEKETLLLDLQETTSLDNERLGRKAGKDRNAFCEFILKDRRTGRRVKQAGIHKTIQYAFDTFKKVLVVVPREHGKTYQALGALLYELGRNRNILIKIVCANDSLAVKRVTALKNYVENSKEFSTVFPETKPYVSKYKIREGWGGTKFMVDRDIIDPNSTVQACITGESLIGMPCDRAKYPLGIPIKELVGRENFLVHSYDIENKKAVCGLAKKVWKVGERRVYNVKYWWVTYSGKKEGYIKATGDHLFLLRDGTYKRVDELKKKDSLMPFSMYINTKQRAVVDLKNGKERFEYQMVGDYLGFNKGDVHHKDGNVLNNDPDNLEAMTRSQHTTHHTTNGNHPMKGKHFPEGFREKVSRAKLLSDKTVRGEKHDRFGKKCPEHIRLKISESLKGRTIPEDIKLKISNSIKGDKNHFFGKHHNSNTKRLLGKKAKERCENPNKYYNILLGVQKRSSISNERVKDLFLCKFPDVDFSLVSLDNHKVISVDECGYENVYDIQVEDHHNFAANGIMVHNSGVLSSGVGDRADLILFDDPCDLRNSVLFPSLRQSVIEAYENIWTPLLGPEGRQWYLATPWHQSDLTTVLKDRWKDDPEACVIDFHIGQEVEFSEKGEVISIIETDDKYLPVWEEQWNRKQLEIRCKEIGSRSYDRAYRCRALSVEETVFDGAWLELAKDETRSFVEGPVEGLSIYIGVDLIGGITKNSIEQVKKGSFFVIIVVGIDQLGNRCVLNIIRKRGLTFQNQKDEIKALKRYKPKLVAIEDNNAQRWIVNEMTEITDLPVRGFTTSVNKHSPEDGVPSLSLEFENGKWILPYGDAKTQELIDIFIGELNSWPISATTDIVMATWFVKQGLDIFRQDEKKIENIKKMMEHMQTSQKTTNVYDIIKKGQWSRM